MKKLKNVLTIAAAAAICMSPSASVYAAANSEIPSKTTVSADTFSISYNENAPRFADIDKATEYVKTQLMQRNEKFDLILTDWTPEEGSDDSAFDVINKNVARLSDDPSEGMYLYMCSTNSAGCIYSDDGEYVYYSVKYNTTAEQEKEVTGAVNKLRETPEFKAAMESDAYDRIKWAYDTVIAGMSLNDDLTAPEYSSAYSALIGKSANETGQIHLLVRLLQEVGFQPTLYISNLKSITNDSADYHTLCLVEVDEIFYFLDPVWEYRMGGGKHRFFMKGYSDLDNENEGKEDFTHVHLFQIFNIPIEDLLDGTVVAKNFYIRSCEDGDVNNDGGINAVDASLILREYALLSSGKSKSFSAAQKKAADIDENGITDAVDSSLTLSYYAYVSTLENGSTAKSIKEFIKK
ncbi:MAG: hypothetical protein IKW96_14380 [Ruminococcus sp.]|uniref:dockerin type I domain-containing protein n=1 Tax=Ruminococcus sp. TaxID=41978 RepID=UPI0025F6498F|nr:dockerin type I domain-containing protein [Ruminococcus sp.]MBR5684437.1 hypothetical protein [Ruminococcus sp.]